MPVRRPRNDEWVDVDELIFWGHGSVSTIQPYKVGKERSLSLKQPIGFIHFPDKPEKPHARKRSRVGGRLPARVRKNSKR